MVTHSKMTKLRIKLSREADVGQGEWRFVVRVTIDPKKGIIVWRKGSPKKLRLTWRSLIKRCKSKVKTRRQYQREYHFRKKDRKLGSYFLEARERLSSGGILVNWRTVAEELWKIGVKKKRRVPWTAEEIEACAMRELERRK